jgi:hypothetical protein
MSSEERVNSPRLEGWVWSNGILSRELCVECSHTVNSRVGGKKTSLVEGYQILRCCEEYPGSLGRGSFPGIFQGADQRLP